MFYGWWLVGVAFLVLMVSNGSIMYSYSVVAVPLGEAFDASRVTMMLGMTGMTLAGGANLSVPRRLDRPWVATPDYAGGCAWARLRLCRFVTDDRELAGAFGLCRLDGAGH